MTIGGDAWRRTEQSGFTPSAMADHATANRPSRSTSSGTARALVYPEEVFAADEAGEMFVHYLHTLTVPDRYTLRELNIATPAP